jgi:hypothetical protein
LVAVSCVPGVNSVYVAIVFLSWRGYPHPASKPIEAAQTLLVWFSFRFALVISLKAGTEGRRRQAISSIAGSGRCHKLPMPIFIAILETGDQA